MFFDEDTRRRVLNGLFDSYYGNAAGKAVVFDTNRTWTGKAALLSNLFPESRIICCVRNVSWIIDSIECMLARNPLQLSRIFNFTAGHSVYARAETLMNSEKGLVGLPWATLRECWFGLNAGQLIIVPYERLADEPHRVISDLYDELDEAPFSHDFENIEYVNSDYDILLGMPGMHTVRKRVAFEKRLHCLPPDLFGKYSKSDFWMRPDLNPSNVKVL